MKTEIAFILDRSGSMEPIRQATIKAFNTFLRDQQAAPGQTRFTLVFFETETEVRHTSIPIAAVTPLNADSYITGGSTALLDAIGETIDGLGLNLAALPPADRPDHVTLAILTDGEENSSRHYDWHQIADRIKHQTQKYSWEFLFLGAGPDTIATASRMGIHAANSSLFVADNTGIEACISGVSKKMRSSIAVKSGCASIQETHDAQAPLADIVLAEDQKRRH